MDRRRFERAVPRVLFVLMACSLALACARATLPEYPAVPGIHDIDLRWQPKAGMRIVHDVVTNIDVSGDAMRSVPKEQRKQQTSSTRTADITEVGPDFFMVRFGQNGVTLPVTVQFSSAWAPQQVLFDDPASLSEQDRARVNRALRQVEEPFLQTAQFFRLWKVGERYPLELHLAGLPGATVAGTGTMTLRQVVLIRSRRAAEFDWEGTVDFSFSGTTGQMAVTGREWRDVATGVSVGLVANGTAEFAVRGQPARMEYATREALNFSDSALQ